MRRDLRARRELMDLGWRVLVIWECGVRSQLFELPGKFDEWVEDDEFPAEWPKRP